VFARGSRPGLAAVALSATVLAACGSSAPSGQASGQVVHTTCREVSAVLSDGPDPGADPVGYAFAQIRPLRAITVRGDRPLQDAVDELALAYQHFYDADGMGRAATNAVKVANAKIDALCPGAAS
jgi:hypothetical protein